MATLPEIISSRLDPSWGRAAPSALVPDWDERLAALAAVHADIAHATGVFCEALAATADEPAIAVVRNAALSRENGAFTEALAIVPALPVEEKRVVGKALNLGTKLDLFHGLGFSVYTSPEVELDEYNFGKLNFAPDHPARDAHDTYFVKPDVVLRTHTSPGWVRAMEGGKPPLRLVFPGRVYRAEAVDASHMDQFHQIDGLFVDRNVSMADLKATLNTFARAIYRDDLPTRIIPIYFPFVEPGVQMDVQCVTCSGTGRIPDGTGEKRCPVCKGTKWVEVLGAGMVHPNVLRAVGIDPEVYTGFAFGMGLERIAMGRYGIPEIRLFFENDLRFLHQF